MKSLFNSPPRRYRDEKMGPMLLPAGLAAVEGSRCFDYAHLVKNVVAVSHHPFPLQIKG
jgi:hypothetical protein